jgi:hypothetical protein
MAGGAKCGLSFRDLRTPTRRVLDDVLCEQLREQ